MSSPVFDKRHVKEYLIYGLIASTAYFIPVLFFLYSKSYQHLYYLFIGCIFFMASIFIYCYKLLNTRYDEKRAVSMLIAGHLATATGVLIASLFVLAASFCIDTHLFSSTAAEQVLPGAAAQVQYNKPASLVMMILLTTIMGNFSTGSFITIIVSYAGKRDQTKDKPVDIGTQKAGVK